MYAMADDDGPTIAEEVYGHMFRGAGMGKDQEGLRPDFRDAAVALNYATKRLKNHGVSVSRWINFVHIGA
ncbi:hypothetical protein FRC02_006821 [Tulasnella sp. 418]|nr:hypothetical protein FRC02_006821 [Tulasnella sp. 418]